MYQLNKMRTNGLSIRPNIYMYMLFLLSITSDLKNSRETSAKNLPQRVYPFSYFYYGKVQSQMKLLQTFSKIVLCSNGDPLLLWKLWPTLWSSPLITHMPACTRYISPLNDDVDVFNDKNHIGKNIMDINFRPAWLLFRCELILTIRVSLVRLCFTFTLTYQVYSCGRWNCLGLIYL